MEARREELAGERRQYGRKAGEALTSAGLGTGGKKRKNLERKENTAMWGQIGTSTPCQPAKPPNNVARVTYTCLITSRKKKSI